eukprot:TRINITY_DN10903_c0_g1_i3.p1 TRINITY_DN10903_c0_g1~~TRINITY_DN10903_c0_g1_i3.p1  ORF type:complete len:250 (-),score=51.61 TRINITY_DN10903_c0_g1_i3:51-800(-)
MILAAFCVLGSWSFCFAPNISPDEILALKASHSGKPSSVLQLFKDQTPTVGLILPLFFAQGVFQSFEWGAFPADVVTPALDTPSIGYVMAVSAAMNMVVSVVAGRVYDRYGRVPVLLLAFLLNALTASTLLYYDGSMKTVGGVWVYGWALIMGAVDAILSVVNPSLIPVLLPKHIDSGFALMKLTQSLGSVFSFFVTPLLSFRINCILLLAFSGLTLGSTTVLHRFVISVDGSGQQPQEESLTDYAQIG